VSPGTPESCARQLERSTNQQGPEREANPMEETCAFCADERSLADGLHPQVPFTLVWANSTWRLFADLTAERSGFSLFAPRRHVATVPDPEPAKASSLGPTLARLMEALQLETGAEAVYSYAFDA
jgi:diadenosine tetraphosphate (Ap4A) HIT family hydrolase